MSKNSRVTHGFTLIELSIVLVVIGLLVGGVLVGQDLIKAAEIRATLTDVNKIRTSINVFREKYSCLPGDCKNASVFFGSDCASGNAADCDGNGDRSITWWTGDANEVEALRSWEHLGLAGLIEGQYTGVYSSTHIIGTNLPGAPMKNLAFGLFNMEYGSVLLPSTYKNSISLGSIIQGYYNVGVGPTAEQAYSIDTKIDDGLPLAGKVQSRNGVIQSIPSWIQSSDCISGSSYDVTATGASCAMFFQIE